MHEIKFAIVVSHKMEPIPEGISIVRDFGRIDITPNGEKIKEMYYEGRHLLVSGTKEAFCAWLRPFDGVWVGQGSPILEEFVICHIK